LHINGKPIGNIKKGFAAACKRAGIEGATPHTLRHTAATWRMQSGRPIPEIARYLGMTEKTLIDTYGHFHPDWLRAAANAVRKRGA
jgi:integrase